MAGGEIAFAHYLARCGATGLDGSEHLGWLRATTRFRRQPDGRWLIVHDHCSAPFDPRSGQTMFGLAGAGSGRLTACPGMPTAP